MSINVPVYIQDIINETPLLCSFVSRDNVNILLDVTVNYLNAHKIIINNNGENVKNILLSMITSLVVDITNRYALNNINTNLDLLKLNKELLTHLISFFKKHGNNLDEFQTYMNEKKIQNKLKEHKLLEDNILIHSYIEERQQSQQSQHSSNLIENETTHKNNLITNIKNKHIEVFNNSLLDDLVNNVMSSKDLLIDDNDDTTDNTNSTKNKNNVHIYNTIRKINTHTTPINNAINSLVYLINNNIIDDGIKELTNDLVSYLKVLLI